MFSDLHVQPDEGSDADDGAEDQWDADDVDEDAGGDHLDHRHVSGTVDDGVGWCGYRQHGAGVGTEDPGHGGDDRINPEGKGDRDDDRYDDADASVLLVVSEISNAMTMAISANTQELCTPVASAMAAPKVSANPVAFIMVPMVRPAPTRTTVPQSIWVASGQVRVESPLPSPRGRKNSIAARTTTAPSLRRSVTAVITPFSMPNVLSSDAHPQRAGDQEDHQHVAFTARHGTQIGVVRAEAAADAFDLGPVHQHQRCPHDRAHHQQVGGRQGDPVEQFHLVAVIRSMVPRPITLAMPVIGVRIDPMLAP